MKYEHPVLGFQQAKSLAAEYLGRIDKHPSELQFAGRRIAELLIQDYSELKPPPADLRILALIGKGNNGRDALVACRRILADYPRSQVDLILICPVTEMGSSEVGALKQFSGRVQMHQVEVSQTTEEIVQLLEKIGSKGGFHICIDGLLGVSFSPPLRSPLPALIEAVNAYESIDLRAAVDLPSGCGEGPSKLIFRADFSYAVGVVKSVLFERAEDCGRIRYIDLGFFDSKEAQSFQFRESVLLPQLLNPLRQLRSSAVDGWNFGNLFIIAGSAYMHGPLLMTIRAAMRSGVGIVTAFVPASFVEALASQEPEVRWVPCPQTNNKTLGPGILKFLMERVHEASAILVGPGTIKDRNTDLLAQEIVKLIEAPIVLDSGAALLRVVEVVRKRKDHFGPVVLAAQMEEFMHIAKMVEPNSSVDILLQFAKKYQVMTVLKSAKARMFDAESVAYRPNGGPVLSRSGSDDILVGLIGGMLAQNNREVRTAVARAMMLHGLAAERLAHAKGQLCVRSTDVLDYLPKVLRDA